MKDTRSPIWLDIETGGTDSSKSSILSIASGQGRDIRSTFASPQAGTFLSTFSEQNILPQLHGKSLLSEKQSIESLISQFEQSPKSPIAGFNIRGFDLNFIQRRARTYGLEKRFTQTMKGRELIDPAYQVKDIIASSISRHADVGTFRESLGGKSWAEAESHFGPLPFEQRPTEYNLISQVKGYLQADRESAMFKGWKLEDVHKLLPEQGKLTGQAHEAATDILMTQRVTDAARTGLLEQELLKPARAQQWMETVKARGYHQFGPGRLLAQADIEKMGLSVPRWYQNVFKIRKSKFIGAGIAGALALAAFSGKDDNYNTIEGLPHGGFAQSGRLQLTDFGSGWKGLAGDIRRAERLYKSTVRHLLTEQGIKKSNVSFVSKIADDQIELTAMQGDKQLFYMRRSINNESIALDEIKLADDLQGKGFGGQFYEYEERIFKRLGLSGVEIQSPTKNPLTARGQILRYGSAPHPIFDLPGIKKHLGVDEEEFLSRVVSSRYSLAEWEQKSIVPTMMGRIGQPKFRPIPSRNSASNIMDGMGHSGIGSRLRELLTPFGSKWDGLRNLAKGTETFQEMLASTGFQKALSSAVELKQLGKGGAGEAFLMSAKFRDKEFQFVRKIGDIGESEAEGLQKFGQSFAPNLYGRGEFTAKPVDMLSFPPPSQAQIANAGKPRQYLDMEFIQGGDVKDMGITGREYKTLTSNLEQIRNTGWSHVDIHEANVRITKQGQVGIIDWGLSAKTPDADDMINAELHIKKYLGEGPAAVRQARQDWALTLNVHRKQQAQLRKQARSALQQSATKTTWEAGKNGGKRSRL